MVAAMRKLPVSLTTFACGASSTVTLPRPRAAKRRSQEASSFCSPPQTIKSCFFCAASGRPKTGAATYPCPAARCASRSLRDSATEMVLIETWIPPPRRPARRPSSPRVPLSRAASSATMVATIAHCSATSRGDPHSTAPARALPFVPLQTRTLNQAATRLAAMGRPMRPSPMNPTASTLAAKERLDPRLQRGADQHSVDAAPQPVGLRAVGVEPEGREVEPLQVHVTHFAQVAKPVLA